MSSYGCARSAMTPTHRPSKPSNTSNTADIADNEIKRSNADLSINEKISNEENEKVNQQNKDNEGNKENNQSKELKSLEQQETVTPKIPESKNVQGKKKNY